MKFSTPPLPKLLLLTVPRRYFCCSFSSFIFYSVFDVVLYSLAILGSLTLILCLGMAVIVIVVLISPYS